MPPPLTLPALARLDHVDRPLRRHWEGPGRASAVDRFSTDSSAAKGCDSRTNCRASLARHDIEVPRFGNAKLT